MDLEFIKWLGETFGLPGMILAFWFWDRKTLLGFIQSQETKMLETIQNTTKVLSGVKTFLEAKLS